MAEVTFQNSYGIYMYKKREKRSSLLLSYYIYILLLLLFVDEWSVFIYKTSCNICGNNITLSHTESVSRVVWVSMISYEIVRDGGKLVFHDCHFVLNLSGQNTYRQAFGLVYFLFFKMDWWIYSVYKKISTAIIVLCNSYDFLVLLSRIAKPN